MNSMHADAREIPDSNPSGEEVQKLLREVRTIAVVGLSDRPDRDSHRVASYLQGQGYRIVPVNPSQTEILGEICYPDLASIPHPVDIVNIFRAVPVIPGIVEEALRIGAKAVWMQLGLCHNASAQKARAAGLCVVQSRCLMVEHRRLIGP
ncbi:MAG: CoA-binding protein [Deltaproteobacteria bacterium]|nr:CoA-binding protein [Deltaproteobacteria bacterium]